MPPTAHDAGFAGAVREVDRAIRAKQRPRALVFTTLSMFRIRALDWRDTGASQDVLLSGASITGHRERFLSFADEDWRRIERLLAQGRDWIPQVGGRRLFWGEGKESWMAVVKQVPTGGLFLLTARRANERDLQKWRERKQAVDT